ncbi:MAG: uroporphyrin-III C-methyltransferase [Pseudomonadota bacterium]|jgi:uroporphyrin-III C-methyltransferase/precorrin-2 dehydrogenase/sirohydrochlorin ferrochelatase
MDYLPLFVRLQGIPVLVVGGGDVAARKVTLLLSCGAAVRVLAPQLGPELAAAAREGRILHQSALFTPEALEGVRLVVAATDDAAVNALVADTGRTAGVLVNVVDNPGLSNCIVPAIIDRSPIVVACSTGGAAPVLATEIRASLETLLPPRVGELGRFTRERRARVKEVLPGIRARRLFWLQALRGPIAAAVLADDGERAEFLFEQALAADPNPLRPCCVLVQVRSEDPDWLPLGALRRLFMADWVLADADVPEPFLALSRRDAERRRLPPVRDDEDFVTSRVEILTSAEGEAPVVVYLTRQPTAELASLVSALSSRACLTELWSAP